MALVIVTVGALKRAIQESGLKPIPKPEPKVFTKEEIEAGMVQEKHFPYLGIREDTIDGTRYSDYQGINIDLKKVDRLILLALTNDKSVAPKVRAVLDKFLGIKREPKLDVPLATAPEFSEALVSLPELEGFNAEVKFMGHWYPITMTFDTYDSMMGPVSYCNGDVNIEAGFAHYVFFSVNNGTFMEDGCPSPKTLRQLFELNQLRFITAEALADYHKRLDRAFAARQEKGHQVLLAGPSVTKGMFGMPRIVLTGTPEAPTKGIVEPDLENDNKQRDRWSAANDALEAKMPFVRIFSLQLKRYFWIDVDNLKEYNYDASAIDRLTLPTKINTVIRKVFEGGNKNLGGDILANRHGGMIILANGGPGVGKTLTAEVFAEFTKRPLYVMEIGEIGTNINELENNLTAIFERVQRWNAVLLFDEADIFLHKRGDNLQHNAVVGIFLRLMDYYRGLLFMTTNRGDAIDTAFQSRITLRLEYPNLDLTARSAIWKTMFNQNGMAVAPAVIHNLADVYTKINGRQIRNAVRLMKVLYPDGNITLTQAKEAIDFTPGLVQ